VAPVECQMSVRADWVLGKIHEPEKRPIDTKSNLLVSYPESVSPVRWRSISLKPLPYFMTASSSGYLYIERTRVNTEESCLSYLEE
jgi:hypothetical protein